MPSRDRTHRDVEELPKTTTTGSGAPLGRRSNGNRAAVLIGANDYDSLVETSAILSDSDAVSAIRSGVKDPEAGHTESADEVRYSPRRAEYSGYIGRRADLRVLEARDLLRAST